MFTNEDRIASVAPAIKAFAASMGLDETLEADGPESVAGDMICNILHWVARKHPDGRAAALVALRYGAAHYTSESYGSVANIFDGCEEDFLRFVHAGLALKFCSSIATTSVSALGPMLKARSTMRASPRMSPVKLKIAAWPLRRARMTSKPLIVA